MADLANQYTWPLGWVSVDIPLISNLDVWKNIALIRQYHENLPVAEAVAAVRELLERFQLESIHNLRSSHLSDEERFCAMLLRATMVREAVVIIDRPFEILTTHGDSHFLREALRPVNDLGTKWYLFDYTGQKPKYEVFDDAVIGRANV